jgi:hypothetical protein
MIVDELNLLDVDRQTLFELWTCARHEHDAANHLLLADAGGHRVAVALHLFRGWYVLASMHALLSGESTVPEYGSFSLDRQSDLLAPIPDSWLSNWAQSFEAIRIPAVARPDRSRAYQPEDRYLRLQARLLGRCLEGERRWLKVFPAKLSERRVGWRKVFFTLLVTILAAISLSLGKRLVDSLTPTPETDSGADYIPETRTVGLEQLSDPKPRGYGWDEPGTVAFKRNLVVSLGGVVYPEALVVSLDGNDRYTIVLMLGSNEVGRVDVEPSQLGGLETYIFEVPQNATVQGFDSIVVDAEDGDGSYSLGHLVLLQISGAE